jgi:glycosyltransferase involved in cell wall biosynthesis
MKLVIINYSMSSKSVVFSHQRETVIALSRSFDAVEVFTCEPSDEPLPNNVKVNLVEWRNAFPVGNFLRIVLKMYPYLARNRKVILFTHMADIHAAIICPLTWFLRIRHVLWYAHATNSIYLLWASFFVSKIISSTRGSCNINLNRHKVVFINQGINKNDFSYYERPLNNITRLFYYGRLDSSKNIHLFPDLMQLLNRQGTNYSLDIFGKSSNQISEEYISSLRLSFPAENHKNNLQFMKPIERKQVQLVSREYDIFVNLFIGSLDKTLIEATFMGLPVVTWNREFCTEFGTWSEKPVSLTLDFISDEIQSIRNLSFTKLRKELERRRDLALQSHEFTGWISRLTYNLLGDDVS